MQEVEAVACDTGGIEILSKHIAFRIAFRKAKVHLELNLTKDVKVKKKGFYGMLTTGQLAKIWGQVGARNGAGDLVTKNGGSQGTSLGLYW